MLTITSFLKRTVLLSAFLFGVLVPFSLVRPAIASMNLKDFDAIITKQAKSADDFYNRGMYFQGQGNLEAALAQFSQAIIRDSDNPDYFFSRGLTYTDLGNHQAAQVDYSRALELDSTFAAAYYQRGMSRIVVPAASVSDFVSPSIPVAQRDNFQQAIEDFSMALRHAPKFVAAHYYRGLSHYVIGNDSLAWQDYQQARNLNPLIAEAFYRQGFTQLYIGGPENSQ